MLLGSTALAAAMLSTSAFAQDAAPANSTDASAAQKDDETVVVVTGIRKSLETASQIKRKADTFVDSITASDVSALPDASVAEALGRIPGVSVSRYSTLPQYNTGGAGGASGDFPSAEGSGNLIRGLSFVRSEFNGRDQFTANGGRALDWSSIPPELVGGVDVYKNASAELIEGGAGGTINLRTLAPFDPRVRSSPSVWMAPTPICARNGRRPIASSRAIAGAPARANSACWAPIPIPS